MQAFTTGGSIVTPRPRKRRPHPVQPSTTSQRTDPLVAPRARKRRRLRSPIPAPSTVKSVERKVRKVRRGLDKTYRIIAHLDDKIPNTYWIGKVTRSTNLAYYVDYFLPLCDPEMGYGFQVFYPAWLRKGRRLKIYSYKKPERTKYWTGRVSKRSGGIICHDVKLDNGHLLSNEDLEGLTAMYLP